MNNKIITHRLKYNQFACNNPQSTPLTMQIQQFINTLDEEDLKKIFPNQYYQNTSKYQTSILFSQAILQFQKHVLKQPLQKHHHPGPDADSGNKSSSIMKMGRQHYENKSNKHGNNKFNKISKFTPVSDTIKQSQQQILLMKTFLHDIDYNLKFHPARQNNTIRNPLVRMHEISPTVIATMQQIQNREYERELAVRRIEKGLENQTVKFNNITSIMTCQHFWKSLGVGKGKGKGKEDCGSISHNSAHSLPFRKLPPTLALQNHQENNNNNNNNNNKKKNFKGEINKIVQAVKVKNMLMNPQNNRQSAIFINNINKALQKIQKLSKDNSNIYSQSKLQSLHRQSYNSIGRMGLGLGLGKGLEYRRNRKVSFQMGLGKLESSIQRDLVHQTQSVRRVVQALKVQSRLQSVQRVRSLKAFLDRKS